MATSRDDLDTRIKNFYGWDGEDQFEIWCESHPDFECIDLGFRKSVKWFRQIPTFLQIMPDFIVKKTGEGKHLRFVEVKGTNKIKNVDLEKCLPFAEWVHKQGHIFWFVIYVRDREPIWLTQAQMEKNLEKKEVKKYHDGPLYRELDLDNLIP